MVVCSPVDTLVHSELWLLLFARGSLAWAAAYYSHAARLRPDDLLVYRGRADAYRVNGEHALAVATTAGRSTSRPIRPKPISGAASLSATWAPMRKPEPILSGRWS